MSSLKFEGMASFLDVNYAPQKARKLTRKGSSSREREKW